MLNIGKDVDLVKLAQAAYALSVPQGLGILHFTPERLSDAKAKKLVARERPNGRIALGMDYVNGRACKLTVFRNEDGSYSVNDRWFDHGDFNELFRVMGITAVAEQTV